MKIKIYLEGNFLMKADYDDLDSIVYDLEAQNDCTYDIDESEVHVDNKINKVYLTKEKTTFIIKDWAGNILFNGKEFNSFEDGWDFIYTKIKDEEVYQDLSVELKEE